MYLHLIQKRAFSALVFMLRRIPTNVTNASKVISAVKPLLLKRRYKENKDLLEALFFLFQLKFEFENAFYTILKKRDPCVFDFLERHRIDFPIHPTLSKLLRIDAYRTVQFIIYRHGRGPGAEKIVKNCVHELQRT